MSLESMLSSKRRIEFYEFGIPERIELVKMFSG